MLYTYTQNALKENWLNSTITLVLATGFREIIAGGTATSWPKIIPIDKRPLLQGRSGIKKRVQEVWKQFKLLDPALKISLMDAMTHQSSVPNIFNNGVLCKTIKDFPEHIETATVALFRFLFEEQLNTLLINGESLRDIHYNEVYTQIPSRICAFCGLGFFRAPGAPRHDLDHYMPISKYPFAGADFKNLAPMCGECNSDFKKNIDILKDDAGARLKCSDPYRGPVFSISLAGSRPFLGAVSKAIRLPLWSVDILGIERDEANNWDRIFKIKERYQRDILDAEFRSWLDHFSHWYVAGNHGALDSNVIYTAIPEYVETVIQGGFSEKAFLKKEVFNLLYNESIDLLRGEDMRNFLECLVKNT